MQRLCGLLASRAVFFASTRGSGCSGSDGVVAPGEMRGAKALTLASWRCNVISIIALGNVFRRCGECDATSSFDRLRVDHMFGERGSARRRVDLQGIATDLSFIETQATKTLNSLGSPASGYTGLGRRQRNVDDDQSFERQPGMGERVFSRASFGCCIRRPGRRSGSRQRSNGRPRWRHRPRRSPGWTPRISASSSGPVLATATDSRETRATKACF